jgi:hypothetical protein
MKALIFNNKVVDLVQQEFEVAPSMSWMDAPDGCEVGWLLENGVLVTYDKRTSEQKAADALKDLRLHRDLLIQKTDWWVLPDRSPSAEQLAYRQALRDITNTYSSLDDVVWPVKPE